MELLTPNEAARFSGRSARTIRRWVRGLVPNLGVEIGGRIYVRRTELEKLLGASVDEPGTPIAPEA